MRGAALDDAMATVAPIVADVRARGDAALLEWTERLDGPRPDGIRVARDAIDAATVGDEVVERPVEVPLRDLGHLDVEHEQRDRDGEDAVAERPDAIELALVGFSLLHRGGGFHRRQLLKGSGRHPPGPRSGP